MVICAIKTNNVLFEQNNTHNFKNNLIDRSDNINEDITQQKNIIDNMLNSLKKDFHEMSKRLVKGDKNVKKYIFIKIILDKIKIIQILNKQFLDK